MKRQEKHTFYNYQCKHTAVKITDHPNIQSVDVAEALGIHQRASANADESTTKKTHRRLAPGRVAKQGRGQCGGATE